MEEIMQSGPTTECLVNPQPKVGDQKESTPLPTSNQTLDNDQITNWSSSTHLGKSTFSLSYVKAEGLSYLNAERAAVN